MDTKDTHLFHGGVKCMAYSSVLLKHCGWSCVYRRILVLPNDTFWLFLKHIYVSKHLCVQNILCDAQCWIKTTHVVHMFLRIVVSCDRLISSKSSGIGFGIDRCTIVIASIRKREDVCVKHVFYVWPCETLLNLWSHIRFKYETR